jgi:hypothetical protein
VSNRVFVTVMLVALLVLALLGVAFSRSGGLPQRFTAAEQKLLNSAMFHRDIDRCMTLTLDEIAAGKLCSYGPRAPKAPRAVLWGDSHALALLPAFEGLGERMGVRVYFAGRSACRPLPGFRDGTRLRDGQVECLEYNAAMDRAVTAIEPDVVVLGAFWAYPAVDVVRDDDASRSLPLAEALEQSVQTIGKATPRICVLRDVPVLRHSVPYGLVMSGRRRVDAGFLHEFDPAWRERQAAAERAIDALPRAPWLVIADPRTRLCQADTCKIESEGEALYRDTNHLSVRGANYVSDSLAGCFADLR